MGQKWLAFLTHKLGGSWGAWEGLERYLRGSRRHLEGFGRASEESKRGNFCGSKMVGIFDPQTWGSWGAWGGLERYLRGSRRHLEGIGGVWKGI